MHYNSIFVEYWNSRGWQTVYQPCCLQLPYDQVCWPIKFPQVEWTDRTIVIMHTQDFVSVSDQGCPELKVIEQHFGERARQVVVIHWNYDLRQIYNGPLNLVYFPTHSYELFVNLEKSRQDWQSKLLFPRTRHWQCLNGIPRQHRKWVAEKMKSFDNGWLSLGDDIKLPDWPYSTYRGCENETNWSRLLPIYADSCVNIVTETMYTHRPGIISEKTLMAFLALQFPILIGYPGMVRDCENLGFDMFRDVIDHSYDDLPNSVRWSDAIRLNEHILREGIEREKYLDRLQRNQQHLLSWPQRMIVSYVDQCSAVEECLTNF